MKKLGQKSTKTILALHFCSLALWLGGALSCLPLLFQARDEEKNKLTTPV